MRPFVCPHCEEEGYVDDFISDDGWRHAWCRTMWCHGYDFIWRCGAWEER